MTTKDKTILSKSGHTSLLTANVVRNANTTLQRAVEGIQPLELHGLSITWNMIHLGQGHYKKGEGATPHSHNSLHLETVLSGGFQFTDNRGPVTLTTGQSLFVLPHHNHSWHCSESGFMLGSLINIVGPKQKQFFDSLQENRGPMILFASPRCRIWLKELIPLITATNPESWNIPSVTSLLQLLLVDFLTTVIDLTSWQSGMNSTEDYNDSRSRTLCRHAMEFLEANYPNPVRLEDVALQVGISPRHLSRLCQQVHGDSINHVLNQIRLRKAHEMLRNRSDLFIKEIAIMTGFERPAYFTACFRKEFGLTPKDLRR